jgi:hypothetical protein
LLGWPWTFDPPAFTSQIIGIAGINLGDRIEILVALNKVDELRQ